MSDIHITKRTAKFIVEIVTADPVTDEQKDLMAQNIADAIVAGATNGGGIVPEDSETYSEIVYVKEWYSDKQIIEHVFAK